MQAFVHPRPGLMTPYLSDDWFRLWRVALDEAERLDMNIWIYDENSYPSGFAGGFVPKAMPESRGLGIQLRETDDPASLEEPLLAVYRSREGGVDDVTADRGQQDWPEGQYLVPQRQIGDAIAPRTSAMPPTGSRRVRSASVTRSRRRSQ